MEAVVVVLLSLSFLVVLALVLILWSLRSAPAVQES
jgi:hypothetical protein